MTKDDVQELIDLHEEDLSAKDLVEHVKDMQASQHDVDQDQDPDDENVESDARSAFTTTELR